MSRSRSPSNGSRTPAATSADDEEMLQRRLLHAARELLDEVHLPRGSWDRALIEKYVLRPLEDRLNGRPDAESENAQQQHRQQHHFVETDNDDDDSSVGEEATAASRAEGGGGGTAAAAAAASGALRGRSGELVAETRRQREMQAAAVEQVVRLINLLAEHKQRTLEVLQAIVRRREAYKRLVALESATSLDDAELQTHALSACYSLRNATLKVVETIVAWRTALTLSHPFMFEQRNYLFTILAEMRHLSELPRLARCVALEFVRFPLFSNMPSLSLFSGDPVKLSNPMHRSKVGVTPPVDAKLMGRLQQAEAYLHGEPERQAATIKSLMALCARGRFVPVLDISPVYPMLFSKPSKSTPGSSARSHRSSAAASSSASSSSLEALCVVKGKGRLEGVEVRSAADLEKLKTVLMTSLEQIKAVPEM